MYAYGLVIVIVYCRLLFFFVTKRRPPRSTRTDTSFPTRRSSDLGVAGIAVRIARITRRIVEASDALQIVSRHGVGYDSVDVGACTDRGVRLTVDRKSTRLNSSH